MRSHILLAVALATAVSTFVPRGARGQQVQPLAQEPAPLPTPPPPTTPPATTPPPTTPPPTIDTAPAAPPTEAPAEAAPRQNGEVKPEGGFLPGEGFVLRSSDESWRLRFRLQSFIRAHVRVNGKAQLANPFMTLRPIMEGNVYKKWIRFWTSLELAASPVYLLDSYVEVQPWQALGIRVGQQWTPFSRHEAIYGPHQLLFPEWNPVADYFWTGRDKGATLFGEAAGGKVDYALGAYVGSPLRAFQPIRGNYQLIARVNVSPKGPVGDEQAYAEGDKPAEFRYAIGINGVTSKIDPGVENFNPSTFKFEVAPTGETRLNNAGGFDFFVQSPRVMGLVEGYIRRTDPHGVGPDYTSIGGFAQLGVLVYKRDVDVAVRGSWVDVNLDADKDTAVAIEGGSSWYIHAPWVVLKLRYGYASQRTPLDGATGTSRGAPLITSPGPVHVLTAQLNTVF